MAVVPSNKELPMADSAFAYTPPDDPEATPTPPVPFSNAKPLSTADVVDMFTFVQKRAEKFSKMVESFEATIAKAGDDTAASLSAAGMPKDLVKDAAAKARNKAAVDIKANSDDARWEVLRELTAQVDRLSATEALWASPVIVLSRAGLGTPERSDFLRQAQGSGPAELRSLAQWAASTGNRVLGAALVSIVDRMPRKDRPFSSHDLARALVGEETDKMLAAIASVRGAVQDTINKNRAFTNGRTNPLDAVKAALRNRKDQ